MSPPDNASSPSPLRVAAICSIVKPCSTNQVSSSIRLAAFGADGSYTPAASKSSAVSTARSYGSGSSSASARRGAVPCNRGSDGTVSQEDHQVRVASGTSDAAQPHRRRRRGARTSGRADRVPPTRQRSTSSAPNSPRCGAPRRSPIGPRPISRRRSTPSTERLIVTAPPPAPPTPPPPPRRTRTDRRRAADSCREDRAATEAAIEHLQRHIDLLPRSASDRRRQPRHVGLDRTGQPADRDRQRHRADARQRGATRRGTGPVPDPVPPGPRRTRRTDPPPRNVLTPNARCSDHSNSGPIRSLRVGRRPLRSTAGLRRCGPDTCRGRRRRAPRRPRRTTRRPGRAVRPR